MNPPAPILALRNVSRRLDGRSVVRNLNVDLNRGSVLGLLGVNGAGKTTTLRMIAGVLAPSGGSIRLDGRDLQEEPELARRRIGYLPEMPPLHAELTAEEFLRFCARLHGLARTAVAAAVARTLERCELGDVRRRPMASLSKGFRQRVGLAQAILHEPELIVLDEPASGLDPLQAIRLREIVRGLGQDHAVVLSTHILSDVTACCDHVAILHKGELRHAGTLASETDSHGQVHVRTQRSLHADDWRHIPGVARVEAIEPTLWRVQREAGTTLADLARAIVERGFGLEEFRRADDTLEQTFLAIAAADAPAAAA